MKRKVIDKLIKWKTEDTGEPILLTGIKGVGKTYLAFDFAKAFFQQICYMNFEREPGAVGLFQQTSPDLVIDRLFEYFSIQPEDPIEARILILDEIGFCKEALDRMKSCDLSRAFRFIICISSNPAEIADMDYIRHLPIYPMEFDDFLIATGNEWYIEAITTHYSSNTKIPDIVHKELLALHQLYLQIGGMPGSINEYLNLSSVINVSEQHSFLIGSYHDTINRDNSDSDALKMNQVFDSLTQQLMKENKKFQYKLIRKGTTHAMYKDAIRKLCDNNYVIKCGKITSEQLKDPAQTFLSSGWPYTASDTNYKLYLPDTGFLYSKMVEEKGSSVILSQRKTLLENDTAQTLRTKDYPFAFWESGSMAKIEFIYLKNGDIIPVEIFESDNTRSKSLSVLKQKCSFPYAVKISSRNFEFSNHIKYVPCYAIFCL